MPKEKILRVETPATLLDFLLGPPGNYSRRDAKNLLRFKAIAVEGTPSPRHDTPLKKGATVRISLGKHSPAGTVLPSGVEIVYEDETIIVVNKPPGLLTIATESEKTRTAYAQLTAYVRDRSPRGDARVFIVHRLDRETSGLLVFARTEAAKNTLQKGWKGVTKKYHAIVEGIPAESHGTLSSALVETESMRVHSAKTPREDAKPATTHYRVLRMGHEYSLLELTLDTGRKNQIRVQLADAGHPIVGDEKYGAMTDPSRRLALHATELNFRHPVTGESMSFVNPLPEKLRGLIGARREKAEPQGQTSRPSRSAPRPSKPAPRAQKSLARRTDT